MIEDLPGEEWRDIAGHEGRYRISNKGRVMSIVRSNPAIRVATPNLRGYPKVDLRRDGLRISKLVHRLVMETFKLIENSDKWEVNHIDFDRANANIENLEWVTPEQNVQHFKDSGRKADKSKTTGERHHLSRLTEADVLEIRRLCSIKRRQNNIVAQQFGIAEATVRQIVTGQTWRHLLPII